MQSCGPFVEFEISGLKGSVQELLLVITQKKCRI